MINNQGRIYRWLVPLLFCFGCQSKAMKDKTTVVRQPQSVTEGCRKAGEANARLIFEQMGPWPVAENFSCGEVIRGQVNSRGRSLVIQAGVMPDTGSTPLSTINLVLYDEDQRESASLVFDQDGPRIMFCRLPEGHTGCIKFASLGRLFSPLSPQSMSERRLQAEFRSELLSLRNHRHAPLDRDIYAAVMEREADLLALIRLARGLSLRNLCEVCQSSTAEVLANEISVNRLREYGVSGGGS